MRPSVVPSGSGGPGARGDVAELDLGAELARACPVDGAVDDDAMQPGCERPAPVESVEVAHRSQERLLGDVLRRGRVAGDEQRRPVGARPVLAEEPLEIGDRPALGTPDPGALRHPSTLRREASTRSIRDAGPPAVHRPYLLHEASCCSLLALVAAARPRSSPGRRLLAAQLRAEPVHARPRHAARVSAPVPPVR